MKIFLRPLALLLALAVTSAAGERAPLEYAGRGYQFRIPPDLVILQDYVYSEASVAGSKHVVVLGHREAQDGDLRTIEINMLGSLARRRGCGDYTVCRVVDGVVIGTDSQDEEFLRAFDAVARTFRASASVGP